MEKFQSESSVNFLKEKQNETFLSTKLRNWEFLKAILKKIMLQKGNLYQAYLLTKYNYCCTMNFDKQKN